MVKKKRSKRKFQVTIPTLHDEELLREGVVAPVRLEGSTVMVHEGEAAYDVTDIVVGDDPTTELYRYRANVTRIYDGDSVTADIDLGLGVWLRDQKLRLFGINTPELRGDEREAGLAARDWLKAQLMGVPLEEVWHYGDPNVAVILETHRDRSGKYGRWLATLWAMVDGDWRNMNKALLEAGHAKEYNP